MTPLRILQVTPYFYPAWAYGGIPRVAYELSRELVRKGHEVTVYTTDVLDENSRHDPGGEISRVDGIKVHYFKNLSNSLAYHHQIYLPSGLSSRMRRSIPGFDLVHLHGHRHFLNNIARHYALKNNMKYVFSGHGTVPRIERKIGAKLLFDRLFGDVILRDAGRLVAVSDCEVKQYEEMGVDPKKIEVIYNGIDIGAYGSLPGKGGFRRKYGLTDKRVILYLGKITRRKGLDFLVRAFSGLRAEDARLVIAGNDMGFKKEVVRLVMEKGLEDRVIFTGLLTGEEKLAAYADADVLVYPAVHEIFGLVPFEAIMCGAPVIVTDDCGCGEIIGREDIGYIVKYGDIAGLGDMIGRVLARRGEALEKSRRGREFIVANLSWDRIAEKYAGVYRASLAEAAV
ncbi:MAG: glycosyltransferase family 4 protein [Nitrospirae bacterium]|nr:glycosyltransferase family 4 protein [Nitrospirota bacterium]